MKQIIFIFFILIGAVGFSQTNLDFENWATNFDGIDEAKYWLNTSDASKFDAPQVLFKEKHIGFNGQSAIRLTTAYWQPGAAYGVDTLVGAIVQESPFFEQPKSFEFSYQSLPKKGDAILVGIRLSMTVNGNDVVVGEGFFASSDLQLSWKKQTVTIKYYSSFTPDKISIIALSSANAVLNDGSSGTAKIGSTLLLDNLRIGEEQVDSKPSYYMYVFPNPAKAFINVETNDPDATTIQIFNLSGKLVLSHNIVTETKTKVGIANLANGTYIYKVIGNNKVITSNKFNVVH